MTEAASLPLAELHAPKLRPCGKSSGALPGAAKYTLLSAVKFAEAKFPGKPGPGFGQTLFRLYSPHCVVTRMLRAKAAEKGAREVEPFAKLQPSQPATTAV